MLSRDTFLSKSQIFYKTNNKQLWVPEAKELDKGKREKQVNQCHPFNLQMQIYSLKKDLWHLLPHPNKGNQ